MKVPRQCKDNYIICFLQTCQGEEERPSNIKLKFVNKTPEEHARHKEETLSRLVPPLDLNVASEEAMREVAADLHAKLRNVYGVIFDLNAKMKESCDFDVSLRGPSQLQHLQQPTAATPSTSIMNTTPSTESPSAVTEIDPVEDHGHNMPSIASSDVQVT